MYCVKCGVKLQNGIRECPLCTTPVWNPESLEEVKKVYPDSMPSKRYQRKLALLFVATVLSFIIALMVLLICLRIYGRIAWGGIVDFGILLAYIALVLPSWFSHPNPVVFIPVTHATAAAYVGYLCLYTRGSWFGTFAAPIIGISALIMTAFAALMKYVRGGRYYIFGGLFILLGGSTMLVELFQHITFGSSVFVWSLYPMGAFCSIGLILILAGIIRPMREFLNRFFFI